MTLVKIKSYRLNPKFNPIKIEMEFLIRGENELNTLKKDLSTIFPDSVILDKLHEKLLDELEK